MLKITPTKTMHSNLCKLDWNRKLI